MYSYIFMFLKTFNISKFIILFFISGKTVNLFDYIVANEMTEIG
jgi:hypothetical protein